MKLTEKNFVQQMILGKEKALEYVMLHYGGLVKTVVHRYLYMLPQYEEDCINDVFYAVWCNISSYQPERNSFANWIGGVARLKSLDYKRKYAKHLQEVSWENAENNDGVVADQNKQIIQDIQREFSEETKQMLDCLKQQDQELLIQLYVNEQSIDEISDCSGMKKTVIYNRLSRAKRKIRNMYSKNV